MNYKTQLAALGGGLTTLIGAWSIGKASVYYGKSYLYFQSWCHLVDTGHKAIKFNKYSGVREQTYKEGFHLKTPWLEREIIFNVKSNATTIESKTGSRGMLKCVI